MMTTSWAVHKAEHADRTQSLPPEEIDDNLNNGIALAESSPSISLSTGSFVFVQFDDACSSHVDYVQNEPSVIETLRNTYTSYRDILPDYMPSALSSIVSYLSYPTTGDQSHSVVSTESALVSTDSVSAETNEAASRCIDPQADQHIQTDEADTACVANSSNTPTCVDSRNRVKEVVCAIPRESSQTLQFDTDQSDARDEEWVQERLKESKSIDDELWKRDCIKQAFTDNCKVVTGETIIGGKELDMLESKGCINSEDRFYMQANHVDPTQRTRRILSKLLLRDYKALLVFLVCLKIQNKHAFEIILSCFNCLMRSGHRRKPACSRCLLENRVDMSLVVDDLLSSDNRWESLYRRVSQSNGTEPRVLWDEFFKKLESDHMDYNNVLPAIIKALEACGFHSDITRKINEDQQMNRNSLVCNCNEILSYENIAMCNPETEQQNTILEFRRSPVSNPELQSLQTTTNSRHVFTKDDTNAAVTALNPEYYVTRAHAQVQTATACNVVVNNSEDRKQIVNTTTDEHFYECAEHGVASPKPQCINTEAREEHFYECAEHSVASPKPQCINTEAREDSCNGNSRSIRTNNSIRNPSEKSAWNESEKANSMKRKYQTQDRNNSDKRQKNSIEAEHNRTNDNNRKNTSSLEREDREQTNRSNNNGQNPGNCDLQIQLLKIDQPGFENEQDSVVSFQSCGSSDSGLGKSNPMLSRDEEETIPKQFHPDLRPSASQGHPETQKITNSGKTEDQHIHTQMPDEAELDDLYIEDAESVPGTEKEDMDVNSDSHWDYESERHDLEDMPTIVQETPLPGQEELNSENTEIEPYINIIIKH